MVNFEEFIERARKVHEDKYSYDKRTYINMTTKCRIICPKHGEFWQTPDKHLRGQGCPKCAKNYKFTKEDFIKRAKKIHGDLYDYSSVDYINATTKVRIICHVHGEFWQTPTKHLSGEGCPLCANVKRGIKSNCNTEDFIQKAKRVHEDRYIYSKTCYINSNTPLTITCPIHGDFKQLSGHHLKGCGCPKCGVEKSAKNRSSNTEEFIKQANQIHKGLYIYTKVKYVNYSTKVCIICPEHGDFWQTPGDHLRGYGCPKCGVEEVKKKTSSNTGEFIEKAKKVHGDRYDYSKVDYVNNHTKVCIICPEHGEFWQGPVGHLRGRGCPKCGGRLISNTQEFIQKADEIHNKKYVYEKTEYVTAKNKVCITCPKHGDFWQTPNTHLSGCGCPKCNHSISNPEDEINKFINDVCDIETKMRDRSLLTKRLECDILVPSHKLAIEFDGIVWHSEKFGKDKDYHLHKTELAESKGYHLIHIFEDEWLEHKELVLNKIRHFLGCDIDIPVVGARKCTIKTLSKPLVEEFLHTYHLQGFVASTVYYGAFYGDILVGVMTFKQEKQGMWNLTRFATDTEYRLPGLASKIFKQFIKDCSPVEVKTFLDRRWSHGDVNVYDRMGFKLTETLAPDYRYVVKNQRLHKFGFRKQILHKKYGLPLSMTEKEMTEQLGLYRIWDCGLYKYVWRKE